MPCYLLHGGNRLVAMWTQNHFTLSLLSLCFCLVALVLFSVVLRNVLWIVGSKREINLRPLLPTTKAESPILRAGIPAIPSSARYTNGHAERT